MADYSSHDRLTVSSPDDDGILVIAVNRPQAKNAIDTHAIAQIGQVFADAKDDAAVRAIIITGEGKVFGVGADIPEIIESAEGEPLAHMINQGGRVFSEIENYSKPTCAAINGVFCLGGSFEMALSCDLRVAGKKARMGLPEATLGLLPGYGGTQRLSRIVGKGRALEMIMTGEPIRAVDALAMGLVNREVDAGDELKAAKELLRKVLANGPLAVRAVKRAVHAGMENTLEDGLQLERELFIELRRTADAHEGLTAQREKRKPEWKGQ